MRFAPGQAIGRYEIAGALGAGGMGEVYRARDTRLNRDVALKFVGAPDAAQAASLSLAEARAAAALSHPHLCTLFEVEQQSGETFIVMELIEGRTLAAIVGAGALSERTVLRYGAQIAGGVAHAHDRQIVHRDLKCGNVMITTDDRAKVLDFGIARRLTHREVAEATTSAQPSADTGALAGTLPYMAPELLRGEPTTTRSDVWALGVVLYEMAAGRRPFTGRTSVELASEILRAPQPPLPAAIRTGLRAIVHRCLEKEPGARYANAGQLAAALEAVDSDVQPAPAARRTKGSSRVWAAVLAILAVGLTVSIWRGWRTPPGSDATIRSLAILPLTAVSGSGGDEYFVDGITDALIGEIGQLEPLRVISRTSVMRYKNTTKSISEIARDLNVDAVLEGSVMRSGPRVRVTAQLVQAGTELSIWTSAFERDVGDIISLQRELARTVAAALEVRLTPLQRTRLAAESRTTPAAVEAYLRGRYQWFKRTSASLNDAIGLFKEAIRHDPSYARAYAGLASCYVLQSAVSIGDTPSSESLPMARDAAQQALAIDPELAEGHAALGYTLLYLWDLPGSEASFRRAVQINPNDANTRFWYSVRLNAEGRLDEALAEAGRGRDLDPVSPIITAGLSWAYHFRREHDRAAAVARDTLAIEPDFLVGHLRLAVALKHLGDARAAAEAERAVVLSSDGPDQLAQLGQIHAGQGRPAAARDILDRLKAMARTRYVPAYDIALVHASLGERDEAFASLRRAYDERYGPLIFLGVDPDVDALRADPRLAALIAGLKRGGR